MTSTGRHCQATNSAGQPCQSWAVSASDRCFWHDPKLADDRQRARRAGGRARHGRQLDATTGAVSLASVADVVLLLERTARDLFALENSISRARAVAYVASVAIRGLEVAELEQRLTRLEEKVGDNGKHR